MDSKFRTYGLPALITVFSLFVLVIALPNSMKGWAPEFLKPTVHLGLDLQGGTQLDFRISETEMAKQIADLKSQIVTLEQSNGPEDETADLRSQISNIEYMRQNVMESVRTVLERRVNSLGVSEAIITPSYYGNEKHLLVECPGVVDVQQCINTVGKTILLEFKEQFEGEDETHIAAMRQLASAAERRITASGETLATVGEDLGTTLGVFYSKETALYKDELPKDLEDLWTRTPDQPILMREVTLDSVTQGDKVIENRGIMVTKIIGKDEVDRTFTNPIAAMKELARTNTAMTVETHEIEDPAKIDASYRTALKDTLKAGMMLKTQDAKGVPAIILVTAATEPKEVIGVSHILIAYKGSVRADESITRSKDRARQLASELLTRIENGEKFERLARDNSDDATSRDKGGVLGEVGRGEMSKASEDAAWSLQKGKVAGPVETEFGFHLIRKDGDAKTIPRTISFTELRIKGENALALRDENFTKLKDNAVTKKEEQMKMQTLFFSFLPTGWKDTSLDGKHFRRATVTSDQGVGLPVVQIVFDDEGAKIFQQLTKKNVGKPIAIFVGGELVTQPIVQTEIAGGVAVITGSKTFEEANRLSQDLNTGAIPAPIHLVGQATVEATLGNVALMDSMKAAIIGFILVALFMIWYYRVLGVIASISLAVYAIMFITILKLPFLLFTNQYIVLTLAGIAGVILSIGMAVDANVLIFERMKEELKKGKMFQTAADIGFKRAWSAIWDSNVSTLLTAGILFIIGTSIVRGFAVTLSIGIILSMFTAIVVTRFLIRLLYKSPIINNLAAFGVR